MSSITGRSALVTGGGSGIGLACAERLVADGVHVTICGRTEDKLLAAVETIGASVGPNDDGSAGSIRQIVADVTIEDQITAAAAFAAEVTGGLDILVANAGGSMHMGAIPEAEADAVRATIDVNLTGTILSVKAAVPHLRAAGGGSVVAMSSGAGGFPHQWLWAYGASKAGIDMFCRSAADELGVDGIRVNSVQPGIVDDELMAFITAGGPLLDHYLENMPLGRVGTVTDIAEIVRFLAGPESSWITGVNIPIDGGHHLRRGADYSRLFG